MRLLLLALLLSTGCKKKAPEVAGESLGLGKEGTIEARRPDVVGPVRWWDAIGLCLEVPAGWSGFGQGDGGRLLTLVSDTSGVQFEILRADAPTARRDLMRVFADEGTYRDIPALGPTGVETWASDLPGGPVLHLWTADVRGAPVRFEARYPFGGGFRGKGEVERLLAAICVE